MKVIKTLVLGAALAGAFGQALAADQFVALLEGKSEEEVFGPDDTATPPAGGLPAEGSAEPAPPKGLPRPGLAGLTRTKPRASTAARVRPRRAETAAGRPAQAATLPRRRGSPRCTRVPGCAASR